MHFNKYIFISILFISFHLCRAQITITNADMPNVNDTFRLSVKQTLPGFNPNLTGPNYTWNYDSLIPDSQRVATMINPGSTGYPFVSFFSTYAIPNPNPDPIPFSLLGTPPTNAYNFYTKSAAQLTISIWGLTISGAALPIPISPSDVIYKFPLNYGNKDSSMSGFSYPVPGTGYFQKKQKRVNTVDGWGQLTTPYGTFNTLRVRSVINITDSIYLDTLGFGFNLPHPALYEYKWLAQGSKLPILEIDASAALTGGAVTVTAVIFRDSLWSDMNLSVQSSNTCPDAKQGSAQVAVTGGRYPVSYSWSNNQKTAGINYLDSGKYKVTVTDRYGKTASANTSVQAKVGDISCLNIPNGFTPDGDGVNDHWNIRALSEFKNCKVEIFNQWGSLVFSSSGYANPWDGKYNNQPAEAGTYYYVIDIGTSAAKYTGSLTIIR